MGNLAAFIRGAIGAHLILALIFVSPGRAGAPAVPAPGREGVGEDETERPRLPDTALGRIMRQWLAVIESGKEEEIKSFVEANFSSNAFRYQQSAARYVAFFLKLHEQSGGLELVRVSPERADQPLSLIVKSRRGAHFAQIMAGLDSAEKGKLAGLGVEKAADPDAPRLSDIARPLSEAEMVGAIKRDVERRAAAGVFSGVVLIARGERILLRQAYGDADREAKVPNTLDTKFHLASVGKMFTAVAIAQLVAAGKLSYTDTIATVLPDYPNREVAEKVTIHQLLTHTAGFGTFFESPGFVRGKTYRNSTEEIAVYRDEKLFFEPGTRWRYSNAGYSLLGAIVERLSGQTYLEYVRDHIFRPLGMRNTYAEAGGVAARKTSVFYTQSPQDPLGLEPYVADRALGGSRPTGFGGGFSTALDMFKFLRAYRTGKLLGGAATEQAASGKVNVDERGARRWAYGIAESVMNGETVRGHGGGSRADVEMLWESGYMVIVHANALPPSIYPMTNDIIAFITKQNAMRGRARPRAPSDERDDPWK